MDQTALFSLSYGVYIVSTLDGERPVGCVVNSIIQVSASPATLAISINKDNYTNPCLLKTGRFAVSVLSEAAEQPLIGTFGFHSSRDRDKFDGVGHRVAPGGLPIVTDGACAYLECKVIGSTDCFTHTVVLAEIVEAERLTDVSPMTYAYYHKVVKGRAPKNAPTYVEEERTGTYVCSLCKYEYPGTPEEFEALPDSYTCPLCGAGKEAFELHQ